MVTNASMRPIDRDVLERYVECSYCAHLRLTDAPGNPSDYALMQVERERAVALQAREQLSLTQKPDQAFAGAELSPAVLRGGLAIILDGRVKTDGVDIRFDALKRVEGASDLGRFHYMPVLFTAARRVQKRHRMVLDALGVCLEGLQGRAPNRALVLHEGGATAGVQLSPGLKSGRDMLLGLRRIRAGAKPPLVLNNHCHQCEFRESCYAEAIASDSLSLLRGLGEKDLKRYARRGLFTITQLAHTFRPRRPGKRSRPARARQHALHALAIRDRTVYVLGDPAVPSSPTRIFMDLEGKEDEAFIYLIGLLICTEGREERHTFWADRKTEERVIFNRALAVLGRYPDAQIFCYGSYERSFLKRMRSDTRPKNAIDNLLARLTNVLEIVYAHFYFPSHGNGLKEIGALLGFCWRAQDASGLQSLVWRHRWEKTGQQSWKDQLIAYNEDDCAALRILTEFLARHAGDAASTAAADSGLRVTSVKALEKARYTLRWRKLDDPDFAFVNARATFDYQREHVFARMNPGLRRRLRRTQKSRNRATPPTRRITVTAAQCPKCDSRAIDAVEGPVRGIGLIPRVKRAFDLRISDRGVMRQVFEYRALLYHCRTCGTHFTSPGYHRLARHFHGLMSWVVYHYVGHGLPIQHIQDIARETFGIWLHATEMLMIRHLMARYYRHTCGLIRRKLVTGGVLHADETEVRLRSGKTYVWVFASADEVLYMHRPNREGAFLKRWLAGFDGVLVSDFYAPYDALPCAQQKCLIHLIRDMNLDIITYPFDSELQSMTRPFGVLLRAIVATIDEHGLARRALAQHKASAERFFADQCERSLNSDAARALQARLKKYRDKLFTFLGHNGVAWNNNNAEHAIRQFTYVREHAAPQMKPEGLEEYLVLLSLRETCRYKGIDFFRFLLSGQRDIEAFLRSPRRRKARAIEFYPSGYEPPHLVNVRARNAGRTGSPSER